MKKSLIFIFVLLLFSTFIYAAGDGTKGGQAGDGTKGGQTGDGTKGGQTGDSNELLYGGLGVLVGAAGGFLIGKSAGNKK